MRNRKKIFKFLIIVVLLLFLVRGGIYVYAKITPAPVINRANNLTLYDSDKKVFFQGSGSKKWISLNKMSKYIKEATIAAEDKNFYKHHGFDYLRILKASITNISNKNVEQGASTITQQYAKNLFLNFDKTWQRKWKEMWYTIELEAHYNKKEILEGYLNTINYGHGVYGIENASEFYFNKSASDLSLAEATMLIGIPKAPSIYSPLINEKKAKERQLIILNSMVKNKMITDEEKEEAYNTNLTYYGKKQNEELSTVMYYYDAVINELKTISSIPKSYSDSKGLKIYTYLDRDSQTNLEETIKKEIPDTSKIQTSVVMMKPDSGRIIALAGGRDYSKSEYNRAISAKRQVGSTMKPYLYYAALENGFTPSTSFTSEKTTFTFNNNKDYSPNNYNNVYGNKPISMATAIAYSENIYAVKTHVFLGSEALIDVAKRVGINEKLENITSLPLGTEEINIIDMAKGYSTFANLGNKVTPHLIKKVVDGNGKILYEDKHKSVAVLNKSLCFILNNLLTSTYDSNYIDYNYPTAINLENKLTHKYALKSGTTDTDNWYIGYNKDIITAVWIGYDDNKKLKKNEYKYGQNIWLNSVETYEKGKTNEWYEIPDNVSGVLVEPISGRPAQETDKKKKLVYFIKGTEPEGGSITTFEEKLNKDLVKAS